MENSTLRLLVASLCVVFVSAASTNETVTYGNFENSSTSAPSEPQVLPSGELKPMFVPHGSNTSAELQMVPVESEHDHDEEEGHHSSVETSPTEFVKTSPSPLFFDDDNSTEAGPTTKATHIMVIPRKNVTMQSENSTDSSMEEDSWGTTHEHYDSSGSLSFCSSIAVVLATLSWAVLAQ